MRALRVLRMLGVDDAGPLERAPSAVNNEVWLLGDMVLRLNWARNGRRLLHEAAVAQSLPEGVRYPQVLACGVTEYGEYLLTRRMTGDPLSRAWCDMNDRARQEAVTQFADQLRLIHGATGPADELHGSLPYDTLDCPHQLPAARLVELLHRAAALPHVDRDVIGRAHNLALQLGGALDDWPGSGLIHGDAHFENVLWDGTQVTAVLDFEFARIAPADVDLDIILRFCADPALHVASDYGHLATRAQYRHVPAWLRQAYPELFAHPRLADRLVLYGLSYDVRELLLDPPRRPPAELPPYHAYHRIRRVAEGRTNLVWMDL